MSATTSGATGRRYGLQRVCQTWERSRSALYARRTRAQTRQAGELPAHRGPRPTLSDDRLLAAIQADLARSPFQGEGHRMVPSKSTRVCGSWTGSGSRARGCCGSCVRTASSPRIAGARATCRCTTGRSSRRRPA